MPWQAIEHAIQQATSTSFSILNRTSIGGGCINQAFKVTDGKQCYFVKTNHAHLTSMFEAESAGLNEILNSQTIRCPKPVTWGATNQTAFLVLEHLEMNKGKINDERFGHDLAQMHQYTHTQFGWYQGNTIGSTEQTNQQSSDWCQFWHQHRLGYQLQLASRQGYRGHLQEQGQKLLEALPLFFEHHQPKPSLLHGDLWSGNYGCLEDGLPVIFDPAVYYGDREADLAMTELFGGFSKRFYAAYQEAAPLDTGYQTRKTLYNLYHILNHLNLFGGSYLGQSEAMMNALLAEIK